MSIGAWCSRPSVAYIETAKQLGIARLNLMVHDDAADRKPGPWEMDKDVHASCQRIVDAGLELHLTAWAQPYTEYLSKACDDLIDIVGSYGACSVCWDAEEPWTQAHGGLDPLTAASIVNLYGAREGVTAIGYASHEVDPLVARASYVAPQVYWTPATAGGIELRHVPGIVEKWRERAPNADMEPALAAYGQVGNSLVSAWEACGKPQHVWLWSLRHIVSHPSRVEALARAMHE